MYSLLLLFCFILHIIHNFILFIIIIYHFIHHIFGFIPLGIVYFLFTDFLLILEEVIHVIQININIYFTLYLEKFSAKPEASVLEVLRNYSKKLCPETSQTICSSKKSLYEHILLVKKN